MNNQTLVEPLHLGTNGVEAVASQKIIKDLIIDPKIFTSEFNCKCNGECCKFGVYTDKFESEKILSIAEKLVHYMDETQNPDVNSWFEDAIEDADFESGFAVGTQIINDKCTFLDKNGLCVLQRLAVDEGLHKWAYKPVYCILFPLTVWENALTVDDEHPERLQYCNKNLEWKNVSSSSATDISECCSHSVFEYCNEELQYFFSQEEYNELLQYKTELENKSICVNDELKP